MYKWLDGRPPHLGLLLFYCNAQSGRTNDSQIDTSPLSVRSGDSAAQDPVADLTVDTKSESQITH